MKVITVSLLCLIVLVIGLVVLLTGCDISKSSNKEDIHREREQAYMQGYEDACKKYRKEPKTGHWIKISPAGIYECSECGQTVMTSDICAYKFCHGCSARMVDPQESEG